MIGYRITTIRIHKLPPPFHLLVVFTAILAASAGKIKHLPALTRRHKIKQPNFPHWSSFGTTYVLMFLQTSTALGKP
jgi:hypothetical protein